MEPTVILINKRMIPFVFVVPPKDLTTSRSQNIVVKDIIDFGQKTNEKGTKNLNRVTFSSFFPNFNSNFYDLTNPLTPIMCVEYLTKAMNDNEVFKLIVPEWAKFSRCRIESLTDTYQDHTGDIYYTITLVEERVEANNVIDKLIGLYRRL